MRQRWQAVAAFAALAAFGAVLLAGCGGPGAVEVTSVPHEGMNTIVTSKLIAPTEEIGELALRDAWEEMAFGEEKLSRHWRGTAVDPETGAEVTVLSDVSRINEEAGLGSATVDPMVTSCLAAAKEVWQLTDGAFDPTVGPLLDLWKRAAETGVPPAQDEIDKARSLVGMDKVEIDVFLARRPRDLGSMAPDGEAPRPESVVRPWNLVALQEKGMELDLGGIAKGYIVGRMMHRLGQAGATAGLIDAGGDVYAVGRRPEALARGRDPRWTVGVQDPRFPDDRSRLYTALRVEDQACVTSGHYERGYRVGGAVYSHIIDPRTGMPVNRRLASVTVVAPDPATADGLATGIAVLGVDKGLALVESLEGVECLLLEIPPEVSPDDAGPETPLVAHRSSGFAAMEFAPEEMAGLRPGKQP